MARAYNDQPSRNDGTYRTSRYVEADGEVAYSSQVGSQRTTRRATQDGSSAASPYDAQPSSRRAASPSQQPAYPVGRGTTYTARPVNRAAGVNPVTGREYYEQVKSRKLSRRQMVVAATAGVVGAAALAVAGISWWTHRAVACTVDGEQRKLPVGCTAQEVIARGFASPQPGNLVSISADDEEPSVLTAGGGEPFTLTVNGEVVDVDAWRLRENDVLVFTNGADVVEDVYQQVTEVPCGIQLPAEEELLATIGYVKQWGMNGRSVVDTGAVSGRTIDRGMVQEVQDLIIARGRINPADGRRLVALTFDDGPELTYTPQYLDILRQYGVKATFFNLGGVIDQGEEYAALSRRCAEEGHQVASHTYSHSSITLSGMSEDQRNEDIRSGFERVSAACGIPTQVVRPPYGELRGKGFLQYLAHVGDIAYSAYWSVDSQDWELPGVDAIVANCTRGLDGDNYNGAVILMHDGGGDRSQDVQALPQIISIFQNAGYELVTMNELLAADPTYEPWVTNGYVTRPEGAIIPDITPYL